MRWRRVAYGTLALCGAGIGRLGAVEAGGTSAMEPDRPADLAAATRVERRATRNGFTFYPSAPELHGFRFALGAFYDAIDPDVMYGFNVRVPQLSLDARYGLGKGWSLRGHLNSMLVTTELLVGGSHAWRVGRWGIEATGSVGVYVGKLARFGFDAWLVSPEYRPELTIGHDFGDVAVSLKASLLLMGPERVRVGEVWGGLDNSNAFVGHSEMLYVENPGESDSAWYFGVGAVTARAYYALWLLFPDTPGLFTYPRVVAGYEF
jgi:hypothetical protein